MMILALILVLIKDTRCVSLFMRTHTMFHEVSQNGGKYAKCNYIRLFFFPQKLKTEGNVDVTTVSVAVVCTKYFTATC